MAHVTASLTYGTCGAVTVTFFIPHAREINYSRVCQIFPANGVTPDFYLSALQFFRSTNNRKIRVKNNCEIDDKRYCKVSMKRHAEIVNTINCKRENK